MALPNDFEAQADNREDLRDTLESAWDEGEAKADQAQVDRDFVASEIDRRDASDRQIAEAAFDFSVSREEARQKQRDVAAGFETEETPDPASDIRKSLTEGYDKAAEPDKPAETEPAEKPQAETEPPAAEAAPGAAWSEQDRAKLDKMTPEDRAWVEAKATEHRAAYAPVNALSERWGGYVAERFGADTPDKQIGVLDSLLQTERTLATGSPQEKAAIIVGLARQYGVGGNGTAAPPAPQAAPAAQPAAEAEAFKRSMAEAAEGQKLAKAQERIRAFATETGPDGKPLRPYFAHLDAEMTEAARQMSDAGHEIDLDAAYRAAVSANPAAREAALQDARRQFRQFQTENPVAFESRIVERMTSLAKGDDARGIKPDLPSLFKRALALEPEFAARDAEHQRRAAEHKVKPAATLRQTLEAAWSAAA